MQRGKTMARRWARQARGRGLARIPTLLLVPLWLLAHTPALARRSEAEDHALSLEQGKRLDLRAALLRSPAESSREPDAGPEVPGLRGLESGGIASSPTGGLLPGIPPSPLWTPGGRRSSLRLPLGGVGLSSGSLSLRVDGMLRLDATARPVLAGRLLLEAFGRRLDLPLPGVQLRPLRHQGDVYLEVDLVLFDRRF